MTLFMGGRLLGTQEYRFSLITVSVARITGTMFETLNNQGKDKQPRIAVACVYFTSYGSVFDEDSTFQIKIKDTVRKCRKDFPPAVVVNDITSLHF